MKSIAVAFGHKCVALRLWDVLAHAGCLSGGEVRLTELSSVQGCRRR